MKVEQHIMRLSGSGSKSAEYYEGYKDAIIAACTEARKADRTLSVIVSEILPLLVRLKFHIQDTNCPDFNVEEITCVQEMLDAIGDGQFFGYEYNKIVRIK